MGFIADIAEGVLGGFFGEQSIFDEARESIVGGCLGILMSGIFLFAFFFMIITLLANGVIVNGRTFELSVSTFPIILLLLVSAVASPFVGIVMGLRRGNYSMFQHLGCFGIWLGILIVGILGLSLTF